MTDDQLRALCLNADPFDYWADVTSWRPPALSTPPGPSDPPPVVRLAVIGPIAGGSPGLIDDIINAIASWVWEGMIKPIINWLFQRIFQMGTLAQSGLSAATRSVLYGAWRWWQNLWWPWMAPYFSPTDERELEDDEVGLRTIITSLFKYPALAILNKVLGWIYWVRDRVIDARDYVVGFVDSYARWVRELVSDTGAWVGDRLTEARDYVVGFIDSYARWVRELVSDTGAWIVARVVEAADFVAARVSEATDTVGGWVTAARDFVVDQMFSTVMAGGAALVEGLADAFDFIFDKVSDAISSLGNILISGFQAVFIGPVDSLVNTVNRKLAIPGKLIRGEYEDLGDFLDDLVDPGPALVAGLVGVIVLGMVISIVTASIMSILVEPLTEPHVQRVRAGVGAQLLQPTQLEEARNRGTIDDNLVNDHLARSGYSGDAKEALKDLRHRIPGSSDLVRFAVREAFDKALATELGFVTPLPGDFASWMDKQGFGQEWSERYWWAHWDLPSVGQGFDMFHRGVIGQSDLELLLRVKDVAPLWQQRLIDIAYTLPSRVDLRRMLKAGIITEAEVLKGYSDRGYDPFWARALTDFAVDWSTPEDESEIDELKRATASQIRLAYRRLVITRPEAFDRLVEIGYREDVVDLYLATDDAQMAINPFGDADVDVRELTRAVLLDAYRQGVRTRDQTVSDLEAGGYLPASVDLLLTLEDVKTAKSLTRARTDLIRQQYVTYEISEAVAVAELTLLGVSDEWREVLLAEWAIDRQVGVRRLSAADLRRAAGREIITEQMWFDGLLVLGYSATDAAIVILSYVDEPAIVLPEPPPEPLPVPLPVADSDVRRRDLERSTVERLYNETLIAGGELLQRLALIRFAPEDAALLLQRLDKKLGDNKAGKAYRLGETTREDTVLQYRVAGFAEEDAERIVAIIDEELEAQRELGATP